jgi:hypothetical protein
MDSRDVRRRRPICQHALKSLPGENEGSTALRFASAGNGGRAARSGKTTARCPIPIRSSRCKSRRSGFQEEIDRAPAGAAADLLPQGHKAQCRVIKCEPQPRDGSRCVSPDLGLNSRGVPSQTRLFPATSKKICLPPIGGCAPTHSSPLFRRDWAEQPLAPYFDT